MKDEYPRYVTTPQSIPDRGQPPELRDTFHFTKEEQEAIVQLIEKSVRAEMIERSDDPLMTAYRKLKPRE